MFIDAGTLSLRVEAIEAVGARIKIIRFASAAGIALPVAAPGAHLDIEIAPGLRRAYSLVEIDPAAMQYAIAVLRQPLGRGGSVALHEHAAVGALFRASVPRNHFPLSPQPGAAVLFGGGIGVTPLLAMHRALKARGDAVRLFYWAREPEDFLCRAALRADPDVRLFATRRGGVPRLADLLPAIPGATRLYCCGPEAMLRAFAAATADRPPALLHVERFAPAPAAGEDDEADDGRDDDAPFSVVLARQGLTLQVPAGRSLLEVCLEAGLDIPYSCEEGVCGACEVRVLEGEVAHRDSVATPQTHARQGTMMICCSRAARGTLRLDL